MLKRRLAGMGNVPSPARGTADVTPRWGSLWHSRWSRETQPPWCQAWGEAIPMGSVVMPCRHGYRRGIPSKASSITSRHQNLVPMSPSRSLSDTELPYPFAVCFPLLGWTDAMRGAQGHRVPPQHMAGGRCCQRLLAPAATRARSSDSFIKPPDFPIPLFLTSVSVSD